MRLNHRDVLDYNPHRLLFASKDVAVVRAGLNTYMNSNSLVAQWKDDIVDILMRSFKDKFDLEAHSNTSSVAPESIESLVEPESNDRVVGSDVTSGPESNEVCAPKRRSQRKTKRN